MIQSQLLHICLELTLLDQYRKHFVFNLLSIELYNYLEHINYCCHIVNWLIPKYNKIHFFFLNANLSGFVLGLVQVRDCYVDNVKC